MFGTIWVCKPTFLAINVMKSKCRSDVLDEKYLSEFSVHFEMHWECQIHIGF